jgi:hypothetical protein
VTDAARATAYRRVGAAAAAAFVALVLLGLARHVDAAPPMPASPQPSLQYPPPGSAAPTQPGGRDRFGDGGAGEGRGRFGGGSDGAAPPSATPAPDASGAAAT